MRRTLPIALGLLFVLSGCPHFDPIGRYSCDVDSDCPHGETCDGQGQCVGRPDWTGCSSNTECPSGYECLPKWSGGAKVCQRDCKTYDDCLSGFRCDGAHCVPAYCSPNAPLPQDHLDVQVIARFLGTCNAHPNATNDGICVGPLAPSSGLLQYDQDTLGLCYATGPMNKGSKCLENVLNGDFNHQCEPDTFCGAGIPSYADAECLSLCGPNKPTTCGSNEGCWLVWGSDGVCVPQGQGWVGLAVGAACNPLYPSGGPTGLVCAGTAICEPKADGTPTCLPTCLRPSDCSSLGSAPCKPLPDGGGGPPGAFYCEP